MNHYAKLVTACAVIVSTCSVAATPVSSTALNSAQKFVECMVAFDAECVGTLTYERYLNEQGLSRAQGIATLSYFYEKLKSSNFRFSRFELHQPSQEFNSDGRTFVFIPYTRTLESPGYEPMTLEGFFIGVQEKSEEAWAFVDGSDQNAQTIRSIIPTYRDQPPLPPVSRK